MDSDELHIPDALNEFEKNIKFSIENVNLFFAVPTIEAWLFADIDALLSGKENEHKKQVIENLPLPETIPYPKRVFSYLFKKRSENFDYSFIQSIDIEKAISRSPSLRKFINYLLFISERNTFDDSNILKNSIPRDVFSTLLQEVPKEKIMWRTLDGGSFDAASLAREIQEGTDIGKQYVGDLLRIARDLLMRKTTK